MDTDVNMNIAEFVVGGRRSKRRSGRSRKSGGKSMSANEAWCVKCRKAVHPENVSLKTTKNGRKAQVGKCGKCGTKTFKFVKG